MKNIMLFIHPDKGFLPEHSTSIKIQIDNSLSLGWKAEDIILATNFPYEYNGVKSLLVGDNNYCAFCPTVNLISVIVELFDRKFIKDGELYWYHDEDAFQTCSISESELDLGRSDMALAYKCLKPKYDTGSIFFKKSAEDIFRRLKEVCLKYQANEEYALMALFTNNLIWITDIESATRKKFVPLYNPGMENLSERIKTLNVTYNFFEEILGGAYEVAIKPIKIAHFHFTTDLILDSFMYGKNSINRPLIPERLIKIFHKHGVSGIFPKKMKNLMIYLHPEKKFLGETENLVKIQIENSLKLGWKEEDLILLTNFPYEYKEVKAKIVDDSLFCNINNEASRTNAMFQLLQQDAIKEAELWWYHNLDVFQLRPIDSSEIDLGGTTAGFIENGANKFDMGSVFFRKGSHKLFEWIKNRTCRLNTDESTAFATLAVTNYRNINSLYKKLKMANWTKNY